MRKDFFSTFASKVAQYAGKPAAFCTAAGAMIAWAASGPFLGFSDVWQLTVNTGTTIVTFLMVFIIQNSQNRDSAAVQIKLDELIRAQKTARNTMLDLEELGEDELERMREAFERLAKASREKGETRQGPESENLAPPPVPQG